MVSYNQLFFSLSQQQLMIDRSILFSLSLFPIAPLMMNDPPNKSSQWMRLYFPCSSSTLDDDDDDQEELEWDRSDLSLPISSSFSRLSTFGMLRLYVQKYTEKISTLVAELFQSDNIDDDDDEADQLDLDTYDIL